VGFTILEDKFQGSDHQTTFQNSLSGNGEGAGDLFPKSSVEDRQSREGGEGGSIGILQTTLV
jgi:hypothetical protein